jgi:hypothetical protein
MGEVKKLKKKCCNKYKKKGVHCSNCPLTAHDKDSELKKEKGKSKEKK